MATGSDDADIARRRQIIRSRFPLMDPGNFDLISSRSTVYNCAAWAVHDTSAKWWPYPVEEAPEYFWPDGARRDDSIEAFIDGYSRLSFQVCENGDLEEGFEKIAVYARGRDRDNPQHVARQLADGRWTSKLGDEEDIEHSALRDLRSSSYGDPVLYMRRPRVRHDEARQEGG